MPSIIIYATKKDADAIRQWLNADPDVAWIVKLEEEDGFTRWKAVEIVDRIGEQSYSLWHRNATPLMIPSGSPEMDDTVILDPFKGWRQKAVTPETETPWFGADPNPFTFSFREDGRRDPEMLARSGFTWLGNRFASIGRPAHPEASRWWKRLRRFVEQSARHVPWHVPDIGKRQVTAFVFPDADAQLSQGRQRELNP